MKRKISYICGYCGREYKSKASRTKHIRKVHEEEERDASSSRVHGKKVEIDMFSTDTEGEGVDNPGPSAIPPQAAESRPDTPHSPPSDSSSASAEVEGNDLDLEDMN